MSTTSTSSGWNRSTSTPKPAPKKPSAMRGVVAGFVVVAIAVVCAVVFMGKGEKPVEKVEKERGRIKEVTPAKAPKAEPKVLTAEEKEQLAHPGMVKSSTGVWQPTNRPWRAGATKVHAVHTNGLSRKKAPVPYHNATEQVLFNLFTRQLGDAPLPMPRLPKKDMENLAGILISKTPIKEDDPDGLAIGKDIINKAKDELAKYIRDGGDVQDFLDHYHRQLEQAYERRTIAKKEIRRIMREEKDIELAKELTAKVNEDFKKEGIRPVKVDFSADD